MEMGSSGSLTDPGSSSPPIESLNGLKFGQKIYFQNAGSGASTPTKHGPSGSGSSGSSGTPPKKVRGGSGGGLIHGGQPPRCQVEGCMVDLSDAKAYYSRHKVCGVHSKSATVIVGGIEQRFCQQCSRFHQLTEFDQGKRSCRRRLAGHNERRRKPPPGSLLSARYGRLPSSMFENSNRVGGFVMDFTAYPKHAWSAPRSSERTPGNLIHGTGKLYTHPWQSSPENPPPDLFLQCSAGGATGFPTPGIPPGECFTGVADSSCALSLLSNQQPWAPTNQASSLAAVSHMAHPEGPRLSQPVAPHSSAVNHFSAPGASWALKTNEVGSSSSTLAADLGLGQLSQPLNSQFSGELDLSQQNRRQFMELDPSRAYDSTHQMHWSL